MTYVPSNALLDAPFDFTNPETGRKEITQSFANTYTLCNRKGFFNGPERLEPLEERKPLSFGDLWHRVMATHWALVAKNQPEGMCHVGVKFYGSVDRAVANWKYERQEANKDEYDTDEWADLALSMYDQYAKQFGEQDQQNYKVLAVELTIRRAILNLDGSDTGWDMVGTPDLILWDRVNKRMLVIDHKSTASRRESFYQDLDETMQGWDYSWLASHEFGVPCYDFMINAARKKTPTKPSLLKTTLSAKKGDDNALPLNIRKLFKGLPSPTKVPDTTYEIFTRTLNDAIALHEDDQLRNPGIELLIREQYKHIEHALFSRSDENGTEFTWRKSCFYTDEHHLRFQLHMLSVTRSLDAERMWMQNLDACELRERHCPYRMLCVSGDGPLTRKAYRQRPEGQVLASMTNKEQSNS